MSPAISMHVKNAGTRETGLYVSHNHSKRVSGTGIRASCHRGIKKVLKDDENQIRASGLPEYFFSSSDFKLEKKSLDSLDCCVGKVCSFPKI